MYPDTAHVRVLTSKQLIDLRAPLLSLDISDCIQNYSYQGKDRT